MWTYFCHVISTDMELGGMRRDSHSRQSKESEADSGVGVSATEKRFAYSLLEKLLEYLDKASQNMKQNKPSSRYSRRSSYTTATEDVKFFGKVRPCVVVALQVFAKYNHGKTF